MRCGCTLALGQVSDGRLVYEHEDNADGFNTFLRSLLSAQGHLLRFGFQSTIEKLKDICRPNASILDGRNDILRPNVEWIPQTQRYVFFVP